MYLSVPIRNSISLAGSFSPSLKGSFRRVSALALTSLAVGLSASVFGSPTTIDLKVQADTYISSGEADTVFGSKGAMMIAAPTASQNRTEESFVLFDAASVKSAADAAYGVGQWSITSVTLGLFSNYSSAGTQPGNSSFNKIAAGGFELDWLSNDNWNENTLTWNNSSSVLPGAGNSGTLSSLGDFYWSANGSSSQTWTLGLSSDFASDLASGGKVSIFGHPTVDSTVGYLFNTLNNSPAHLYVTVDAIAPVPEPGTGSMVLAGLGLSALFMHRRHRFLRQH
jgi:hypothetical protein